MHIVLGILGTLVTLLILVNRLQENGVDIGWLNPFSWHRRRKFRKAYHLPASYSLDSPMDVAALFMLAVAKADGDITKKQKDTILDIFQTDFKLSASEANNLLGSSAHILGNGADVKDSPKSVVAKSEDSFTTAQVDSTLNLIQRVASIEGAPSDAQQKLVSAITAALPKKENQRW
ncbi:TerB family tellurite resistance protein [Alteromonas sp. KUL49]|uniref:TerB family tellurite resistance protein n=1 Tax=Alteromonas sp. KUL49 TaxID=2480798 RepID=UPI00102EF784|nr:TerB family tellurite resistance protein [Alteromonas sp. KUL49]TAP35859.1 TerB family tellurite resistance protein [Alteromonas sp. KUL49]GEA13240.1 hypothetical protein KUL49_36150 [Alteromonas sp. KUL49]